MRPLGFHLALIACGLFLQGATGFSLSMSSSATVGSGKTAVIAGATGYIGKSVVRESVRQGYKTIALVRDKEKVDSKQGKALFGQFFEGADVIECDVTNPEQLTKVRTTAALAQASGSRNENRMNRALVLAFEAFTLCTQTICASSNSCYASFFSQKNQWIARLYHSQLR